MTPHSAQDDAHVTLRQVFTATILPWLVMFGGLAGVYAVSVANDREQATQIVQLKADVTRLERESKEVRGDVRSDLKEIKDELRELRAALIGLPKR